MAHPRFAGWVLVQSLCLGGGRRQLRRITSKPRSRNGASCVPQRTAWRQSVATGTLYEQEERHRQADGTYRWFLARGIPLRDSEGRTPISKIESRLRKTSAAFLDNFCTPRTKSDAASPGIYTILPVKTSSLWPPRWVNCMIPFLVASENHANFFLSARR